MKKNKIKIKVKMNLNLKSKVKICQKPKNLKLMMKKK